MDLLLPLISRWAHIGCAIVLIGGSFFVRFALMPALQGEAPELTDRIRKRWKKFVHGGIPIFLISGLYNYIQMIPKHKGDGLYHMLLGTKMILAMVVFYFASVLVGSREGTQKIRDNARKWMGLTLLLATIIVGISGFVKVRGIPDALPETASDVQTDVP